jgi:hypothetical protein
MMKFDDVWRHLRSLRGQRFHTLHQEQPFTLHDVAGTNLMVRPESTGNLRPIQRSHFQEAWQRLTQLGRLSRTEIHREISPFNPAYVLTLLAQVPGVTYRLRPIVLTLSSLSGPSTDAPSTPPQSLPVQVAEQDDPQGNEEIEEPLADRLVACGRQLGYEAVKEWRTDLGNRIDVVWAKPLPTAFPGFAEETLLPVVGFEIESSWRTRKHVKGDIFNLQDLSPALGIIVLCKGRADSDVEIQSLRVAAERYIRKLGLRIHVWSDAHADELWRSIHPEQGR